MKITEITSLAHPLDLSYVTNEAIVLLSVIAFFASSVFWIVAGKEFLDSTRCGFIASFAVFL